MTALSHASAYLVPEHLAEVKDRRERQADKQLKTLHERLIKEISHWSDRYMKLTDLFPTIEEEVQREYKQFNIDAENGHLVSMTMR